eukprot:symbB.v1.2.033407.t1/scaffold4146.1/size43890/5
MQICRACSPEPSWPCTSPIYAFSGGLRFSNAWMALSMSSERPIYSIDLVSLAQHFGCTSMEQLIVLISRSISEAEVSLAGWSLGARAAMSLANCLERCGKTVDFIYALDDRRKFPFEATKRRNQQRRKNELTTLRQVDQMEIDRSQRLVNVLCAAERVPAFRVSALC